VKSIKPPLFTYLDHRKFLADFYALNKAADPSFSLRYFARKAGLKSYTYLKFVIDGKRKLTPTFLGAFETALELTEPERRYFRGLVRLSEETNGERRRIILGDLLQCRPKSATTLLGDERTEIYREWYFLPLMELTETANFREEPRWIAKRLKLTVPEVKKALALLERLKVLVRDSEGKLRKGSVNFDTSDEISKSLAREYHAKSLMKAAEKIHLQTPVEREYGSITFAIDGEKLIRIKEKMQNFRREIFELLEEPSESGATEVYQWNAHMFRISETLK
jgi:uncharacterized protein (TIGR02147 family)